MNSFQFHLILNSDPEARPGGVEAGVHGALPSRDRIPVQVRRRVR